MIKNFIFDFDGTLADSSLGIYKAFASSCVKNNLKPPDISKFKQNIGPPIYRLIYKIYPNIEENKKINFVKTFREEYDNVFYKYVDWYEGVFETINFLSRVQKLNLFIITNKPTKTCIKILRDANILNFFKMVIGVDYRLFKKEHKASNFDDKSSAFDYFFSRTTVIKNESIYVGDTLSDKVECDKSELKFIAVNYGFYKWDSSIKNLPQVNSIVELQKLNNFF